MAHSTQGASGELNFKNIIEVWAYVVYQQSHGNPKRAARFLNKGPDNDFKSLTYDVNWEKAHLTFTKVDSENDVWIPGSKDINARQVYQSGDYFNSVSAFTVKEGQKVETKARYVLDLNKGRTTGLKLKATLDLPREMLEAKSAPPFGDSILFSTDDTPEKEASQGWTLDADIPIPQNRRTQVKMMVRENTFKGTFTFQARLSGRLVVQIQRKKNGVHVDTVEDDVGAVFRRLCPHDKSKISPAFNLGPLSDVTIHSDKAVFWTVSGSYMFMLGTDRNITVGEADGKDSW